MNEQEIRAKALEIVITWLAVANRTEPWDNIMRMADKNVSYIKNERDGLKPYYVGFDEDKGEQK